MLDNMAGIATQSPPHVVMGFQLKKCIHSPEVDVLNSFPGHLTVGNICGNIHNFETKKGSTFEF